MSQIVAPLISILKTLNKILASNLTSTGGGNVIKRVGDNSKVNRAKTKANHFSKKN